MKLKKKEFEKNGKGSVSLIAEESEDLWHLYNLVAVGDAVKATTWRKIQKDEGQGTETRKMKLMIEVKKVEYDAAGDAIRFSGTVCEESEWVKMGAHHTIEIELNELITITKDCWDEIFLMQLEDATNIARSAEVATVLLEAKETGNCNISLLTNVLAKRVANVQHGLPKKRITTTQLDKAMEKFFEQVYEAVKKHIDFELVKCVVLGGPGSTKKDFNEWMQKRAMQSGDSQIVQKKGIFLCVDAKTIHNAGLEEILGDEQVKKRIANTRAALHLKSLEEFEKRLGNEETSMLITYGKKEVAKAHDMGAIDTMMISDALFRNASVQVRKEYVQLVADVKDSGSTVHVFSSGHVTGQKIAQYANIAAVLRFQIEYEADEADAPAGKTEAAAAPAEAPEQQTSATSSAPAAPELARQTSSTSKQQLVVLELMAALGGKVSEARIELALTKAKGQTEDAYLTLLGEELSGTGKEPDAAEMKSVGFAAGDTIEVLTDFKSNNKTPGDLPKGLKGKVIKIDDAGDAYIDFGDTLKKHWVKGRSFHFMQKCEAEFAPPVRTSSTATTGKASSVSAKAPAAKPKPATKPAAKPKPKGKNRPSAALQWDDYDY